MIDDARVGDEPAMLNDAQEGDSPVAVEATPAAAKAAEKLGVPLAAVEPTGATGKVTKADVEAHAAGAD